MKYAGVDTGGTTGLVIVDENFDILFNLATKKTYEVLAKICQYTEIIVVLERAGTQEEYSVIKGALQEYGIKVIEFSPGEWKPNPHFNVLEFWM